MEERVGPDEGVKGSEWRILFSFLWNEARRVKFL